MPQRSCLALVLAAGEGTRMRSTLPKAVQMLGGRPLLAHVLAAAEAAGCDKTAIVLGPDHGAVAALARELAPKARVFEQRERLGTAHAVLAARAAIAQGADDILVMFADTPLVPAETLAHLREPLAHGAAVAVLGFRAADPFGYGRLVTEGNELVAIREERDASPAERAITLCNAGLMALSGKHALALLDAIGNANAKGEYYLTDAVAVARAKGLQAVVIETAEDDVRGINTKAQLAEAEAVLQQRLRAAAMEAGVTMIAPETVFLCADTQFGKDVTIEPNVVFGPGVTVDDGATIRMSKAPISARAPASVRSPVCGRAPNWAKTCTSATSLK
jgi:bifunctional UDP-N-acetylglucosamine pyrophosphorylase/glucosamine-1-phosphate N-acetyltransferase